MVIKNRTKVHTCGHTLLRFSPQVITLYPIRDVAIKWLFFSRHLFIVGNCNQFLEITWASAVATCCIHPRTHVAHNLPAIDLQLDVQNGCDGLQQKFQHAEYFTYDPFA